MSNLWLSAEGLAFIASQEGLVLHVYKDIAGVPTIGYGHVLRAGESYPSGITKDQALALLSQDTSTTELAVNRLLMVEATQGQFDALVSFAYNVGAGALRSSTLLRLLNAGNADLAAEEFPKWDHAVVDGKLVEVADLLARRRAEQAMFLGNQAVA